MNSESISSEPHAVVQHFPLADSLFCRAKSIFDALNNGGNIRAAIVLQISVLRTERCNVYVAWILN